MSRALRSACLFAFVSAIALLSVPGCSQQGQGERCDSINGDTDCDTGLSCIPKQKLLDGVTDRCCPAENTETDARCHRVSSSTSTSGGSSSTGGSSSPGGAAAAGDNSGGTSSLPEVGGTSNSSAGTSSAMMSGGAGAASGGAGAGGAP